MRSPLYSFIGQFFTIGDNDTFLRKFYSPKSDPFESTYGIYFDAIVLRKVV